MACASEGSGGSALLCRVSLGWGRAVSDPVSSLGLWHVVSEVSKAQVKTLIPSEGGWEGCSGLKVIWITLRLCYLCIKVFSGWLLTFLLAREGLKVLENISQNKALELRVLPTGIWGSSFRAFHVSIFQFLPKWDELPWWQNCRKSEALRNSRFAARPLGFLRNERGGENSKWMEKKHKSR